MLVDFEPGVSPLPNQQANLLPLGMANREMAQYGMPSQATRRPRLITLKGELKPRSWNSSVDTVGTLAPCAHVFLEFTRTFRFRTAAKRNLQVPEHFCKFRNRSLIEENRRGKFGMSGARTLNSNQLTESRREFMKAVFVPTQERPVRTCRTDHST